MQRRLSPRPIFLFLLLIPALAVIHDSTNWRPSDGRNLNQVQTGLTRHLQRLEWRHDANLLALVADDTDLTRTNPLIDPDKTLVDTVLPEG